MTQRQLNCAVAQATGESIKRVARMGFTEAIVPRPFPLRMSGLYRRARSARINVQNTKAAPSAVQG